MRLSRLERKLLRLIQDRYPLPWNAGDKDQIVAIGERPLATEADLAQAIGKRTAGKIGAALHRLIAFQCIIKIYMKLYSDFREIEVSAGRRMRMPQSARSAKPRPVWFER